MPDDEVLGVHLNENGHGTGLIPSPPDSRDFQIEEILAVGELAAAPATYVVPGLSTLPVLNQGSTPQCVAYSHSSLKAYEDRKDQGVYFNFNENYFFQLIGGTSTGAIIRNALDRLVHYGYPVVSAGQAWLHKITAYYRVPKDIETIKQAVMAFGPVVMGTYWYASWERLKTNYQLPYPSGSRNGHAVIIVGWDARGFRCRNSWGTAWGYGGDFWMPYSYALTYGFEFWKAVDQIIAPATTFGVSFRKGTYTGYKFSPTGAVLSEKTFKLGKDSSAPAFSRVSVPGQTGGFFTIAAGVWAGYKVREGPGVWKTGDPTPPINNIGVNWSPAKTISFAKGTHTGYKFGSTGLVTGSKTYTLGSNSSASASAAKVISGESGRYLLITNGVWAGYLVPESSFVKVV